MADHFINGRTATLRELVIAQRRGIALSLDARLVDHAIDLVCSHSRRNYSSRFVEHFATELARYANALLLLVVQHLKLDF